MPRRPWYNAFFEDFQPIFKHIARDTKETNAQVRYLLRKLDLKPGMTFLDCPCGFGRVSLPLAKKGIKVTGVDLCKPYVEEARERSAREKLRIEVHHGDMRKIAFKNRFDAAGNLWTSFGYFDKGSDNLLALKKMHRALKPGGKFCLHVINRDWILTHYSPRTFESFSDVMYTEERQFDFATSTNRGVWTFYRDGHCRSHTVGIRMYSYHELVAMFKQVGFVDVVGFGSTRDEPISAKYMMMWVFGTKSR